MSKHTKEPWYYRPNKHDDWGVIRDSNKCYMVARAMCYESKYSEEECRSLGLDPHEPNARRIVQCVNACAGMDDPEKEIQSLRTKLESLRTWIIENTVDVEGQDGVKWNCIERDEILEYLNNQNK